MRITIKGGLSIFTVMEDIRKCILLDSIRMLNGSCSIDKLALLMYIVDKQSGFSVFTWSIEDYFPVSQDFLDTVEELRRGGYVVVDNGKVSVTSAVFDSSICSNHWLYGRLISYVSDVIGKYKGKDVNELLSEVVEIP